MENTVNPEPGAPALPRHLWSLDALRGLGAIAVVFTHWQHFFFHGTEAPADFYRRLPLFSLFHAVYADGWRAVEMFFTLSGFIFFWLYGETVARHRVSPREFFILRFSRLYPLHLATLLFVAAGQIWMVSHQGAPFVTPNNDAYHFLLQLCFASHWGLESGGSFNGPIWSVSIEVLLYAVFFVACWFNLRRAWSQALLALAGLLLVEWTGSPIGTGLLSFFLGGLAYRAFVGVHHRKLPRFILPAFAVATGCLWVFACVDVHHNLLHGFYRSHVWSPGWDFHGGDPVGQALLFLTRYSFELLVFPLTILWLAVWESRLTWRLSALAALGQISYSTYLLHFPLQLVFVGFAVSLAIPNSIFYRPAALLLFFAVLFPLAFASFHFFELPAQRFLRHWLLSSKRPAAAEPGALIPPVSSERKGRTAIT